jgi:DNA adenine methylase
MVKESSVAVDPVAPYMGGKRNLAKTVIARIDKVPHVTYAEPFIGMGGIFLRRSTRAKGEIINDYSRDVATFFRVVQRHYTAFVEMIRFQLTTRVDFDRLLATEPDTLTDLERSARFLYLQRTTFGGKIKGRSFGVSPDREARFDPTKVTPMLEELHIRLAGVTIECLPYGEFIDRYDRPTTLFYLDPPYWDTEDVYGKGMFGKADFERLAQQLAKIKGRFILSINDVPQIRKIFAGFKQEQVRTTYTARGKGHAKPARELIISRV